uniref:Vacuolar protein-sorting-associated protein 36 n=1 Tax=Timema cristinae TaxID=61476 RepID=A0A7R9GUG1_TIMCR|nr:unnamed protein product [Timema cristinae]
MDRFEYTEAHLVPGETSITKEKGIKLYDGEDKTSFENGEVLLTTHRLLWGRPGDFSNGGTCLSLQLRYVVFTEEERPGLFGFSQSKKISIHLSEPLPGKTPGPVGRSKHQFIKLSFKEGMENDFLGMLNEMVRKKKWETVSLTRGPQVGIVGIERNIEEKHKATDESITVAFQDLSKLMGMAKDMVNLSKTISQKIREKQGDITEDETVKFKSYLLSLGIDDPVTRGSYRSENQYYQGLARELADILETPIKEVGGMMSLTDVYCRVNRARGLELISPEDLLNACNTLEALHLPIRLRQFDSGVTVLQLQSYSDANIVQSTSELLAESKSITAEELAQSLGISVVLAKERLITTEKYGKACRDDSIEGLRFYPNLFLQNES